MKLVLDASLALSWIFERQKKEEIICAENVLKIMADDTVIVPALWHTEVANALLVAERRNVISEAQTINYLSKLSKLPITTDDNPIFERREFVMALAREYDLTAYDATYLELALRENAALATFDSKLAKSVSLAGGNVFK